MLSSPKSQQKDTIPHAWWYLVRSEFTGYNAARFQKDLLAALTVAAVALPLALAYGVAAGASAAAGLVTSIVAGILVGVLGGAPASVSGPTGGLAAVLVVFAGRYGMQGVWIIGLMAGVMLIIMGIFRLGRIVALIPSPVIAGFTSGIAIIIAVGQIDNALGIKSPAADSIIEKIITYFQIDITPNPAAFGLTLLVVGIMLVWPRFRISEQIPGSLAAIMIATLLLIISGWDVPVIGTIPRSILLEDRLNFANIRWSDISLLIGPAMAVAGLGAIESLLCGVIAENATGRRPQNRVELVAQGIANLVMPFIGGIPAASALSRTSVNLKSGGLTRLAPIMHGVVLLLIALILAPIIGRVPLSAL
ncbi:MAG: SulP family sulfate permease, partial [Candidatus Promineifilaceae bacterium]